MYVAIHNSCQACLASLAVRPSPVGLDGCANSCPYVNLRNIPSRQFLENHFPYKCEQNGFWILVGWRSRNYLLPCSKGKIVNLQGFPGVTITSSNHCHQGSIWFCSGSTTVSSPWLPEKFQFSPLGGREIIHLSTSWLHKLEERSEMERVYISYNVFLDIRNKNQ